MALTKCANCGHSIDYTVSVCPECGTPVSNRKSNSRTKLFAVIIVVAAGLILAIFIQTCEPVVPMDSNPAVAPAADLQKTKTQAEGGDPNAQNLLGEMYSKGNGAPQDYKEAAKWYRLAADQGHALGQKHLSELYDAGRGVPHDEAEAAKWCQIAAEQGLLGAQYSLAVMFASGQGVKLNDAEAVKWYRRAAEQGDTMAQYNLGDRYTTGRSVPKDPVEAYKWLSLASAQGLPDATRALDGLKSSMSSEQLAEGQRRVADFSVKQPTKTVQ